jgi:hypothetical protein
MRALYGELEWCVKGAHVCLQVLEHVARARHNAAGTDERLSGFRQRRRAPGENERTQTTCASLQVGSRNVD